MTITLIEFFKSQGWNVLGVGLSSLVYLLIDFSLVIKRFRSILETGLFWLFWFCISILNLLAFEALRGAQEAGKEGRFGPLQGLALIVMSTLGTVAVLQSFALKIGDRNIVDLSKFVGDFRAAVLQRISRQQARAAIEEARAAANRLEDVFKDNEEELRRAFVSVMSFAGRTPAELKQDLVQITDDAGALKVGTGKLLAQRIAQADTDEANRLWWKAKSKQE